MDRPQPPADLADPIGMPARVCVPAPDVEAWLREAFVEGGGPLENPEHAHLRYARIGVLWCAVLNARQGNAIAGQAEIPMARGGAWAKARHDQQLEEWFGAVPDFVLTFDPVYAAQASDLTFCALVEHELYHCGQARDGFGAPRFTRDGTPAFTMRGHDVEEFVGVVERYGAGSAAGKTAALVEAANRPALFGAADVRCVCGNCL